MNTFDWLKLLKRAADTEWPAPSMNLLASFVRVKTGESLTVQAKATSQTFYVIRSALLHTAHAS